VLGLPIVNLVYRHLAAAPGRLEATWRELRPNLVDSAIDAAAEQLAGVAPVDVAPLPVAALAAVGVGAAELAGAVATLDAYNHANPRNLLAIVALLGSVPGGGARSERPVGTTRPPLSPFLPMADLRTIDGAALVLLEEMARPFSRPGQDVLVPGLFRHFAHNPPFLALLWSALSPLVHGRGLARTGNVVAARARALSTTLPCPVRSIEEPETREALERFVLTISRMIVAGTALRRALPGPP
jgi:hypothetical protein